MKNFKELAFLLGAGALAILFSCSKMDDTYKQFVVPNGITYIGKAKNVFTNAGRERIKLSWVSKDPKANMARVYWNNKADSLDVPVLKTGATDTTSVIVPNLSEGTYVFQIYTFDKEKNKSIPVEAIGASYGDVYEEFLNNRVITKITKTADTAFISILSVNNNSVGTKFVYTNVNGVKVDTLMRAIAETIIKLRDMNADTSFTYQTLYVPQTSIDTFYSKTNAYP